MISTSNELKIHSFEFGMAGGDKAIIADIELKSGSHRQHIAKYFPMDNVAWGQEWTFSFPQNRKRIKFVFTLLKGLCLDTNGKFDVTFNPRMERYVMDSVETTPCSTALARNVTVQGNGMQNPNVGVISDELKSDENANSESMAANAVLIVSTKVQTCENVNGTNFRCLDVSYIDAIGSIVEGRAEIRIGMAAPNFAEATDVPDVDGKGTLRFFCGPESVQQAGDYQVQLIDAGGPTGWTPTQTWPAADTC